MKKVHKIIYKIYEINLLNTKVLFCFQNIFSFYLLEMFIIKNELFFKQYCRDRVGFSKISSCSSFSVLILDTEDVISYTSFLQFILVHFILIYFDQKLIVGI